MKIISKKKPTAEAVVN